MLDPVVAKAISLAFALLLAVAAWHKTTDHARFRGILTAYEVLPAGLAAPAAWLLAASEAALAAAWALGWRPALTASATAGLLTVYTLAIGLNLLRGRVHIDCGCGFGGGGEQLSRRLLLRNFLLILLAPVAAAPVAARQWLWADYISLAGACLALALLYAAGEQLRRNAAAIGSWRKPLTGAQAE